MIVEGIYVSFRYLNRTLTYSCVCTTKIILYLTKSIIIPCNEIDTVSLFKHVLLAWRAYTIDTDIFKPC